MTNEGKKEELTTEPKEVEPVEPKEKEPTFSATGPILPRPADPLDRLAKEFSDAARQEIKYDNKTGKPYRVNHAILQKQGNTQLHLWIDIDEAPRKNMLKSLIMRREQMVGDGLQISYDQDHWNSIHPNEEQINLPMDFTDDIMRRKNDPEEIKKAS